MYYINNLKFSAKNIDDFKKNTISNKSIEFLTPFKDICPRNENFKLDLTQMFLKGKLKKSNLVDWRICKKCTNYKDQAPINEGWPMIKCSYFK